MDGLRYYTGVVTEHLGRPCIVTRTGYTGEDGFELIVRAEQAEETWENIFRAGANAGVAAAGLGAGTRCGWKRACRCTGTSCRRRSIRSRPGWASR